MALGEGRGPPAPAEPPGRGPAAPDPPGRGPAAPAPAPAAGPPDPPGRGIPCEGANGLLPGRALPGRGAPAPRESRGAASLLRGASAERGARGAAGASGSGSALAAGRGPGRTPGVAEAGDGAAAAAGAAANGLGDAAAGAAGGAGVAAVAAGAASATAGAAASGAAGAGAFGRAGAGGVAGWLAASTGNFSRTRRSTGDSIVDDADLTYSPIVFRWSSRSLLLMFRSRASSCTRVLATTLLLRVRPGREDHDYWFELIAGCSSGAHRLVIPLSSHRCLLLDHVRHPSRMVDE